MIEYWQAVVLGVIQGITEFLPISSSGHLAMAQRLMSIPDADSPGMIFFDVMTHVGTLIAILAVFFRQFGAFLAAAWRQVRTAAPLGERWRRQWALRLIVLTAIATAATAAVGFPLKRQFEAAFEHVGVVGIALVLTGTLLFITRFVGRTRRGLRRIGPVTALLVGAAQGFALAPGISRSGATISTGLLCDVRRQWAAQFAFLVFVPAVLGVLALKAVDLAEAGGLAVGAVGPVLVGTGVSAVVGYVCLRLLLGLVRRRSLWMFSLYCWPVGLAAILWGILSGDFQGQP
jgi:undecaprenyl-diphosphatase